MHNTRANLLTAVLAESSEQIARERPELRVIDRPNDVVAAHHLARLFARAVPLDSDFLDRWGGTEAPTAKHGPVAGIVKWFNAEKGVGAISTEETAPHDVWVHFSAITGAGYRQLDEDERVVLTYEPAAQDSFRYRAVEVTRER